MSSKFEDYKIDADILKALNALGYDEPTEVQNKIIPNILNKVDTITKSQTGSGKTAAFAIPICSEIKWDLNKPQVLVLAPTRELAMQVQEEIQNIGRYKRIKASSVFGKSSMMRQVKELRQKTHVVVGTPGRIINHIDNGTVDFSEIKYLVIDEADEMLNMGFVDQLDTIISSLPTDRNTILLSATIPDDISRLCSKYMKNPELIEIESKNTTNDRIDQLYYLADGIEKLHLLEDITIKHNPDSCMIFCNTKSKVDEVYRFLNDADYSCTRIHGGLEQDDRTRIMKRYKAGKYRYLISTDVAARGIDVDDISLVINYDIPFETESYVHRIGRTGRKDTTGVAVTLMTSSEKSSLEDIIKKTGNDIVETLAPTDEEIQGFLPEFKIKMDLQPQIKQAKSLDLDKDIMKIHINAGKKTKMRASDIVGTLCNLDGVTKEDIGIINILDISTFVEILNGKGQYVFDILQEKPIKGRMRRVSKANEEVF